MPAQKYIFLKEYSMRSASVDHPTFSTKARSVLIGVEDAALIPSWHDIFFPKESYYGRVLDRVRPEVFEVSLSATGGFQGRLRSASLSSISTNPEDCPHLFEECTGKGIYLQTDFMDHMDAFKEDYRKKMFSPPSDQSDPLDIRTSDLEPAIEVREDQERAGRSTKIRFNNDLIFEPLGLRPDQHDNIMSPGKTCLKVANNENYVTESIRAKGCDKVEVEDFLKLSTICDSKRVETQEYLSDYRYKQVTKYYKYN